MTELAQVSLQQHRTPVNESRTDNQMARKMLTDSLSNRSCLWHQHNGFLMVKLAEPVSPVDQNHYCRIWVQHEDYSPCWTTSLITRESDPGYRRRMALRRNSRWADEQGELGQEPSKDNGASRETVSGSTNGGVHAGNAQSDSVGETLALSRKKDCGANQLNAKSEREQICTTLSSMKVKQSG